MVESKQFLTRNLKINAVANFIFYALVYYIYYKLNEDLLSPSYWRLASFFMLCVGCFVSVMPAIARKESNEVRFKNAINYVYFAPLYVIAMYVVGYLAVSFFHWSFSFEKGYLENFCYLYLIVTPIFGWLMIKTQL